MPSWSSQKTLVLAAAAGALAVALAASVALGREVGQRAEARLTAALARSLPNTRVSAVDCGHPGIAGLCEVTAGEKVFYATPDGRLLVVGQVLDLARKVDLTERRVREVAAVNGTDARLADAGALIPAAAPAAAPPAPSHADLPARLAVDLPVRNAIVHNRGAPLRMTVFTDFNCHYCQQLFADLKDQPDIEVTEYPIAFLGLDSAVKARRVLCAKDRAAASAALYAGGRLEAAADCAEGGQALDQNVAFARAHNINGTPTIVRPDGATHPGWLPADRLRAWLAEAKG
jgi:thiol:disulfide interchange protein DsbC